MKKIILIPAVILLVCCVTVGAFNFVSGSNNRPMTFYESLVVFSQIDFSLDEMSDLLYTLSDMWNPSSSSTGTHIAGFGSPNYKADTGIKWLDTVLDFLSNCISTFYIVIQIVVLLIKDAVTIVYTLFDLITRFVVGVPKTTA